MTLQMPHVKPARSAARLLLVAALALAGGMSPSAGGAAIRLLGVSGEGNVLLIEATEPASYAVKRPDALTILVELRDVSVANAANHFERRDPISGVAIEQGEVVDGKALARVRVSLARPRDYTVRSARNTIRLELTSPVRSAARAVAPAAAPQPF